MPTPTFRDGRLHERELYARARTAYPFAGHPTPDVISRVHERLFLIQPERFAPNIATRETTTNLLTYSTTFANAAWTKNEVTATDDAIANPADGYTTASRLLETATTAAHYLTQAVVCSSGPAVLSVFAKGGLGRDLLALRITRTGAFAAGLFNLALGTAEIGLSLSDTPTVGIQSVGDGWYRCWVTTPTADATSGVQIIIGGGLSYAGDITKGVYLYGAALEYGLTPGALCITGATSASVTTPLRDTRDPFAYLVEEGPLTDYQGDMARCLRTYARIPRDQIIPGARMVDRPTLDGVTDGTWWAASLDNGRTSHLWSSRKAVSIVGGDDARWLNLVNPSLAIAHQQVSIVVNSGTATFYLDDSDASIKSALATALGFGSSANWFISRYGGIGFYLSWAGISVTVSSVTFSNGEVALSSRSIAVPATSNSGPLDIVTTGTALVTVRRLTIPTHGAVVGDRCALWLDDTLIAVSKVFVVEDTDNLFVENAVTSAEGFRATHFTASSAATKRVVNGARSCTVRTSQKHYLPGASGQPATADAIPLVESELGAEAWLTAIRTKPTGWAVIAPERLESWRGPILLYEYTEVQVADAIEEESV